MKPEVGQKVVLSDGSEIKVIAVLPRLRPDVDQLAQEGVAISRIYWEDARDEETKSRQ